MEHIATLPKETVVTHQVDVSSNPAPLGLLGFGMTTVLLNLHNAGLFELGSMILAMGVFYGGIAQIMAGLMEFRKGNTFGTTAFISYGFFWLSFVALIVLPKMGLVEAPQKPAIISFLVIWGIFTSGMFLGTLKLSRALQFVFASLALLFFLLAIADSTESPVLKVIAGIEGIICGSAAIYTAFAQIINELYGRELLPL
ncbi:MAG: acetate uptake transporter [Fibrobacterales bacterium]